MLAAQTKLELLDHLSAYLLTKKGAARLRSIPREDLGYGYDKFGMNISAVTFYYALLAPLYDRYFAVQSFGHEHLPRRGAAVLVANHAGSVAYDGLVVVLDLLKKLEPPRLARAIIDRGVANVPYLNILLQRCGQVVGARRNFTELINREELILTFPESRRGFHKKWAERHQVGPFNVGFLEIAYRHQVPIIPTAILAEETHEKIARVRRFARPIVIPGFPPLLFPLPQKYYIYYGEPLLLHTIVDGYMINQPELLNEVVEELRRVTQELINRSLALRGGASQEKTI